jgi:FkbM family methyltransferase
LNYEGGSFVEAGANDGLSGSNTAMLERELGWRGALVEPSPEAFRKCVANRENPVYNCALVDSSFRESQVEGDFAEGHLMGSVGGVRIDGQRDLVAVPARTLAAILDEVGLNHVNFLSLDVEGYELQALKGCDFDRVSFDYLLVELQTANFRSTVGFLREQGYKPLGNLSNYNEGDNPGWDGTHNDYLFAHEAITRRKIRGLGAAKPPPGRRRRSRERLARVRHAVQRRVFRSQRRPE